MVFADQLTAKNKKIYNVLYVRMDTCPIQQENAKHNSVKDSVIQGPAYNVRMDIYSIYKLVYVKLKIVFVSKVIQVTTA